MAGKCNFLTGKLFGKGWARPTEGVIARCQLEHLSIGHAYSLISVGSPEHHSALSADDDTPNTLHAQIQRHLHGRILQAR